MNMSSRILSQTLRKGLANVSNVRSIGNQARVNKQDLQQFQKLAGFLSPNNNDIIMDFGCGNGETTIKMAKGEFLNEKPGRVIGVDIDSAAINTCRETHDKVSNASFFSLDISDPAQQQKFLDKYGGQVSLITAFFSLHLVPDQQNALNFFYECLKEQGKFVCSIYQGMSEDSPYTMAWKGMVEDKRFSTSLSEFQPRSCTHDYVNNDWMKTNKDVIQMADYHMLLEGSGFVPEQAKEMTRPQFSFPVVEVKKNPESRILFGRYPHAAELQAEFIKRYENLAVERGIDNTLEYFHIVSTKSGKE